MMIMAITSTTLMTMPIQINIFMMFVLVCLLGETVVNDHAPQLHTVRIHLRKHLILPACMM